MPAAMFRDREGDNPIALAISQCDREQYYAWVMMMTEHYRIHCGLVWQASLVATELAPSATLDWIAKIGSKSAHLFGLVLTVSNNVLINEYRGATYSGGTPVAIWNKNSNYDMGPGAPTVSLLASPTVLTTGVLRHQYFIPGGSGGSRVGAIASAEHEEVLAPNTVALRRLTNQSTLPAMVGIEVMWYEE